MWLYDILLYYCRDFQSTILFDLIIIRKNIYSAQSECILNFTSYNQHIIEFIDGKIDKDCIPFKEAFVFMLLFKTRFLVQAFFKHETNKFNSVFSM
jgi:hypothetical protein